jgi:hypothetical protein
MPAADDPRRIVEAMRHGPVARKLTAYLAAHFGRFVENELLLCALYGDDPAGGPLTADKCLHLFVHQLRPKLATKGLAIENGFGRYRMTWLTKA